MAATTKAERIVSCRYSGRIASTLREWAVREADYETNMRRMEALYRRLVDR